MKAFFIAFKTFLTPAQLNAKRRKLFRLLREKNIEFQPLKSTKNLRQIITQLMQHARAAPVIAVDDEHPLPDKAPWLADLTREALTLEPHYRPRLIYMTHKITAEGGVQASQHALIRKYIKRDDQGHWVNEVVDAVLDLAREPAPSEPQPVIPAAVDAEVVGVSPCFREAMAELSQILQSPYGLVTGEQGVGKMFFIRVLWRKLTGRSRIIILPCGSFFKDYYVGGIRRRIAEGRKAIDELRPYLEQANNGLLVLHHVEQLPTSIQEELAVRLPSSASGTKLALRVTGVDGQGLIESDLRIVATSRYSPELLQQTGRLTAELALKLRKRHVHIPSLAERGSEDIRLLSNDILHRICARQGLKEIPRMDDALIARLSQQHWPDNLSDLVRVLEYAMRRSGGGAIRLAHLPKDSEGERPPSRPPTLDEIVSQAQRTAIENALEQTGGIVSDAAELLGRNPKGLYRLMRGLKMRIPRHKTSRGH